MQWHGTYKAYGIGFTSSLILTITSFLLAAHAISPPILVGLALLQAILQLYFFLHLGQEANPKWETWVFYFMLLILLIIVLGSLWIMDDLHMRMMHHD